MVVAFSGNLDNDKTKDAIIFQRFPLLSFLKYLRLSYLSTYQTRSTGSTTY